MEAIIIITLEVCIELDKGVALQWDCHLLWYQYVHPNRCSVAVAYGGSFNLGNWGHSSLLNQTISKCL